MTRIILVRHGHVDWIIPERFRGRAELALSAVGQAQAKATARLIAASWQLDALYTSPLGRARETAAAVAEPFGIEPQAVEALSDIDYGDWQGLTREAAVERWPQEVALWFRAPHLARIPGGETLAAVLSRTSAALHDILLRHPSDAVAILGHDSVNRVMLLHAMELPLSRYWHFRQDPCAVNELFFDDDAFVIAGINATQHLAGLQRA